MYGRSVVPEAERSSLQGRLLNRETTMSRMTYMGAVSVPAIVGTTSPARGEVQAGAATTAITGCMTPPR